jgi:HK97 family phage major capsid protein
VIIPHFLIKKIIMSMTPQERRARIQDLLNFINGQRAEFPNGDYDDEIAIQLRNAEDELERHRIANGRDMIEGVRDGRYSVEGPSGARLPSQTRDLGKAGDLTNVDTGRRAAVERGESFGDHPVVRDQAKAYSYTEDAVIGMHGSFGNLIRAMSTTSGSAVVPTIWASKIIDRARNTAAVIQAGANVVPMDANVVKIGRLTTDPTAAFRNEGNAVTASDPVFDNVTLTAKTLSALVVGSIEWFQDSPNVDQVVQEAIAKAIAIELDLVALFGGLTSGAETGATGLKRTFANPPNPTGILSGLLSQAASSVLGGGANGTTQTTARSGMKLLMLLCSRPFSMRLPLQ